MFLSTLMVIYDTYDILINKDEFNKSILIKNNIELELKHYIKKKLIILRSSIIYN